jgi:hypothetical protein
MDWPHPCSHFVPKRGDEYKAEVEVVEPDPGAGDFDVALQLYSYPK